MKSDALNILIVEDELLIAEMLQSILVELKYNVVAKANNFASTFAMLKKHPNINFVFLDINLSEKKQALMLQKKLMPNSGFHLFF
jgi:CheY-like chemotaxis protein